MERPVSATPSFGILSTYPPTPCGLATFSAALADGLAANGADVNVVRVADGTPSRSNRVVGELINGSPSSVDACSDLLNNSDVAVIQHEYGIYGGADGDEVISILGALQIPSIVVLHTVPKDPTRHQRSVLEAVAALADQVVVMSDSAALRLCAGFDVERRKVSTIPHGAAVTTFGHTKRSGRPTLLTWGLLGPGKGIERVIDAMGSLHTLRGSPRYLIAGRTHPKVLAAEGEAYREARAEQARRAGISAAVHFDAGYRDVASLSALAQSASVVVLPYDSTDQVTSGVLVDAIASGRPVVATAFPHAVELLATGAGIVVPHDDPDAMTAALEAVLTQPRLAGGMAAEARRLAPAMAWPVVATSYQAVAHRILAKRSKQTWLS
ncbi:glycosyltransferase [Mycolicibacterium fluoranthenivorans]|uniref:Glycosyltransferase n=1 Tax=Mycolicibacterium fluoranthenivorans TaxID=258505 RepID=A0A7G8PNT5_9MYCO|nr:glycosyltransferase [Mycobacterium hackensackense]QNJ96001.1 glycosyltransferase [Mycolicibacterium fluoranthenivorans]